MECNREEALRAKEIAKQKFTAKDVMGAKKFALKAQNLFPELEGISQMIATMDVYLAAEVKINGESDWYSILCVNASADEETVKKQYRKLALQLHPDKNKSIGSEGAFKLLSEAWSVLSDKTRKMVYDQKRNTKAFQQKASQTKRDRSVPGAVNGFYDFANNASNVKTRKKTRGRGAARSSAQPSSCPSNSNTFWTSCNKCRMQYEYLRVYLNHNLLCPNCHEAFLAIETGFPANRPNSSGSIPQQGSQKLNRKSTMNNAYGHGKDHTNVQGMGHTGFQHGANIDSYNNSNCQWGVFSRSAEAAGVTASTSAAVQAANIVHQTYEKVRKRREEAQATTRREEALQRKNHILKEDASGSGYCNASVSGGIPAQEQPIPMVDRPAKRRRGSGAVTGTKFRGNETDASGYKVPRAEQHVNSNMGSEKARANGVFVDSGKARMNSRQHNLSREFAKFDIRNMLMEKTKAAVSKKLEEWNSAAEAELVEKEKAKQKQTSKSNHIDSEETSAKVDGDVCNQNMLDNSGNNNKQIPVKKNLSNNSDTSEKVVIKDVSIDVTDPDFIDFDKDRSEGSFKSDQVWATYDNEDGMPRFYALVQKVISLKPFKMRMSFLNSKSNNELGPMNWVASGFAKTCGDFRIGKYEISDTVNIFSHRVKLGKGARGTIRIVPRKGDTWALYRNWSPNWNELTPDDLIHKYDMVEVLDDYNEEQGVLVTPLVKVAGFKTVFHRHLDSKEAKRIPREEMFRFSHQVPSYLLTGEEAHNAPKGCRELDPAATPLELLQVITEVKEDDVMETAEQQ